MYSARSGLGGKVFLRFNFQQFRDFQLHGLCEKDHNFITSNEKK